MIHSLTPRDLLLRNPDVFKNFSAFNQSFVLVHVNEHCGAPASLREHDWPVGGLNLLDERRRISPELRQRPDIFAESNAHALLP